jgi:hypothetical protein
MSLTESIVKNLQMKGVKRVNFWDQRYYKVLHEITEGSGKKAKKKMVETYMDSVTRILNILLPDFLMRWRGDLGNERADQIVREAFNLGSFIHFGAEVLAKGGGVIFNPVEDPVYTQKEVEALREKLEGNLCICRWQKEYVQLYRIWQFFQLVRPQQVETEQTVFSITHKYAGTLDLLMFIKEGEYMVAGSKPLVIPETGFYLGDWKTGKQISTSNKRQLSAYIKAVQEGMPKLAIKGGLLLHPNNEQITSGIRGFKATLVDMEEADQRFEEFLKIMAVFKIENPTPTPEEFAMPAILQIEDAPKALKLKAGK